MSKYNIVYIILFEFCMERLIVFYQIPEKKNGIKINSSIQFKITIFTCKNL